MLLESEEWWCTEYAEEIHEVLRRREYDRFGFEGKAPKQQIQWRMHIIQYMLDVAKEMKLSKTTLHLAVYYLDIFMDNHAVRFWRFHLVALVALRIAAKIEEKDFSVVKAEELISYGDYIKADYNILEALMLRLFDWDLNIPTVATFAAYYIEFVVDESDFYDKCAEKMFQNFHEFQDDVKAKVVNLVDQTVYDIRFTHDIPSSKVAAMCMAAIRFQQNLEPIWPAKLQQITRFSWDHIKQEFSKLLHIQIIPRERLEDELNEMIHQETQDEYLD